MCHLCAEFCRVLHKPFAHVSPCYDLKFLQVCITTHVLTLVELLKVQLKSKSETIFAIGPVEIENKYFGQIDPLNSRINIFGPVWNRKLALVQNTSSLPWNFRQSILSLYMFAFFAVRTKVFSFDWRDRCLLTWENTGGKSPENTVSFFTKHFDSFLHFSTKTYCHYDINFIKYISWGSKGEKTLLLEKY